MKRGGPLKRTEFTNRGSELRRSPMKRRPRKAGSMPPDVRETVLARDRWTCQAHARGFGLGMPCAGRLHIHHVVLRSHGGRDVPEDLLTLCDAHHTRAHTIDRAGAEETGVIRRRRPADNGGF